MRVLHLIDQSSPQASDTTLAMLGDSLGRLGEVEQAVLLLGGLPLAHEAQGVGLAPFERLGVPMGKAVLGLAGVQRWLRGRPRADLVHCWSVGTLTLASLLMGRGRRATPILMTVTVTPEARVLRYLRVLLGESGAGVTLLAMSATIRRALLSAGLPEPAVHVLRPGIDMARVAGATRAQLRRSWGVDSERTAVAALLCDPCYAGDALPAALASGLADETLADGRRVRLVVHTRQRHRLAAIRMARQIGCGDRVFSESRLARPWEVLPGCDVALAMGPHAGGLSLLWAMAAGVPIVGEASYAISEIIEDRHSALLAKPDEPKSIAHRVKQLLDDPALAWRLRDTARHEAYSFFSRARYCQSLAAVYEQATRRQPVEVPPMESTGGLRFAGRG